MLSQGEIEALLDQMQQGGLGSEAVERQAEASSAPASEPVRDGPALEPELSAPADPAPNLLPRLLDLPVTLTVKMAESVRRIDEVLGFVPGTVLEMEDPITRSAEVSVNGQILARGEIVVVDGYYGVHIQEVVSPKERLQGLSGSKSSACLTR